MSGQPAAPDFGNSQDDRIHFDKSSNTWRLEDDDGTEMEWDSGKAAWVPVLDEDVVREQQAAYSVAGVNESEPVKPVLEREKKGRKRKQAEDFTSATAGDQGLSIKRGKGNDASRKPAKPTVSKNTAVYVTGLPIDTEVEEIVERFGKCGVLMEDDDGDPKVKLYADEHGRFNGEALVVFFKEDSVILAENLLDDAELRIGDSTSRMRVKHAEFGHKNAAGDGTEKAEVKKRVVDKKKATKRMVKMQKKLEEWDSEDEFGPSREKDEPVVPLPSRVVLLKHMFTLQGLAEDPSLILDLKEDVREECENLGVVTNVVLYDKEPDGIMTVKFKDVVSAQACLLKMNGRFFDGRKVQASFLSGKPQFKRSGKDGAEDEENDGEEKQRLDEFAKWLEKSENGAGGAS